MKDWDDLWEDLVDLVESDAPRTHFFGSIVTMPTNSVPEGVPKFLLIDGQQRLTTIFLLLAAVRDLAREDGREELAEEIHQTLLVNKFKKDNDHFKLMPTQTDRSSFQTIVKDAGRAADDSIARAYAHLKKKMEKSKIERETIKRVITERLSIVSIVLDRDDNPYLVFEGLNARGAELTQADLIRNFFFLKIHQDRQDEIHATYWEPMQQMLGDNLTAFIRHYLMRTGQIVKENAVYFTLKEHLGQGDAIDLLHQIHRAAGHYVRLIRPQEEPRQTLREALGRLGRLNLTVYNPFLLNCYDEYDRGDLKIDEFVEIVKCLENYLIRRFVCDDPTNQLNKILAPLYKQIKDSGDSSILEGSKRILSSRGYPGDTKFKQDFIGAKLYRPGVRLEVAKLILESLEQAPGHKESVDFNNTTIEHVMPKTLSPEWRESLGEDADDTHELYLDTIGNLTLTGYNSELSNSEYQKKRVKLRESHLELNKYFSDVETWGSEDIERRADALAEIALGVWPSFGKEQVDSEDTPATGVKPKSLKFLGEVREVKTWRDVLENTLELLCEHDPEAFQAVVKGLPRLVGPRRQDFREARTLKCGLFFNVNYSKDSILQMCRRVMEVAEIDREEWEVRSESAE